MQEPETFPAPSFRLMQEPETLQESALRLMQETEALQESAKGEAAGKLWGACFIGGSNGEAIVMLHPVSVGFGTTGRKRRDYFSGPQQERRILSHWFRLWHGAAQN